MTFFYDLNKKLSDLAAKQTLTEAASHQAKTTMKHVNASDASPKVKAAIGKAAKDIKPGIQGYRDRAAALTAAGVKEDDMGEGNEFSGQLARAKASGAKSFNVDGKEYPVKEGSTGDYSAKKARAGKDIGKPGKAFAKIAKSAGEKYGSKARGEKVAGAVLAKLRAKESIEETQNPNVGQVLKNFSRDVKDFQSSGELSDNLYSALFDVWSSEMPYGTAKARTGDPYQWISQKLNQELGMSEGVDKQAFAALAPPRDKITFADKIAGAKKEVDEMLGDVAAEAMKAALGKGKKIVADESRDDDDDVYTYQDPAKKKTYKTASGGTVTHHGNVTRHQAAPGRYGGYDPESHPDKDDDKPGTPDGEKRGKGRPKGTGKSLGAKGPSGKSKLMTREGEVSTGNLQKMHQLVTGLKLYIQDEDGKAALKELTALIKHYVNQGGEQELDEEQLDELSKDTLKSYIDKAATRLVSGDKYKGMDRYNRVDGIKKATSKLVKQEETEQTDEVMSRKQKDAAVRNFMSHDPEAGEKILAMGKKDAEDFASTKHKGLPEKKAKKKEDVEETTTSGSVAVAPAGGKTKANGIFGKSVYENKLAESFNNKLNAVLSEGMSINMSVGEDGTKSLTVNATNEDAEQLAQLLKMAGLGGEGGAQACSTCGESACGCEQMSEGELANSPEPGYSDTDTMVNTLSGGLNGRKDTGQTVGAPFNRQSARQGPGIAENKEAELWKIYSRYSK